MAPVAAPTPAPRPLAVLLNLSFCCGCRGGSSIFRLIDYYSFLLGFYLCHFYLHGIDYSLLSIATSMESTVAVFAASKSIFLDFETIKETVL
jgi:hypothetical protein